MGAQRDLHGLVLKALRGDPVHLRPVHITVAEPEAFIVLTPQNHGIRAAAKTIQGGRDVRSLNTAVRQASD